MLQLINEYDPQPPFHAGNVKQAGPILTEHLQAMLVSTHKEANSAALEAQKEAWPCMKTFGCMLVTGELEEKTRCLIDANF
jgi:hypothetical protein